MDKSFSVARRSGEEVDPFDDLHIPPDTTKMEGLMSKLQPPKCSCSSTEFVNGDDELAVCAELDRTSGKSSSSRLLLHQLLQPL